MFVFISGEFASGLLPPCKFTKLHTNKITDQEFNITYLTASYYIRLPLTVMGLGSTFNMTNSTLK